MINFLTTFVVFVSAVEVHAGGRPPAGYCSTFTWGGTSNVHLYVCCNNKNEISPSCDGKTYHTGSSGSYCRRGGEDNGNGRVKRTYRCGGCKYQDMVQKYCLKQVINSPGFCWMFTDCFSDTCKRYFNRRKRRDLTGATCWNRVCDPGETIENCPIDCCQKINPKCKPEENKCLPKYCNTQTCKGSMFFISSSILVLSLLYASFYTLH